VTLAQQRPTAASSASISSIRSPARVFLRIVGGERDARLALLPGVGMGKPYP
jgi:hypothetical protein